MTVVLEKSSVRYTFLLVSMLYVFFVFESED